MLIFVADPCFNEPGWEKDRGTDVGDKKDFEYSAVIKTATLEWAILTTWLESEKKQRAAKMVHSTKSCALLKQTRPHHHYFEIQMERSQNENSPAGHLEK